MLHASETPSSAPEDPAIGTSPSLDALLARHKKEQRDLVASTTSLKKQATKKTRKNVLAKCADLQAALDAKHKLELQELNGVSEKIEDISPHLLLAQLSVDPEEKLPKTDPVTVQETQPKRRNRQKDRLAKRKADIEQIRADALVEAENSVDYRKIEEESMAALLRAKKLALFEIKPDGHCLFALIQDQLKIRHQEDVTVLELRLRAAAYIRAHPDDFTPFLFDEATMSIRDVAEYADEVENTALWGSDMEILAIAKEYDCAIEVLTAGSAPILFNEAAPHDTPLRIAFYKHSYGLGEHYNSLRNE